MGSEQQNKASEVRVQKPFKEFFVCPNCSKPLYSKEDLPKSKDRFCSKCGYFIIDYIEDALCSDDPRSL